MDRGLYLSMSAARNTTYAQAMNAHNLANATTPGFRADLAQFSSIPVLGQGYPSRVYALLEGSETDFSPGQVQQTGNDLDIAINGDGWIAVQTADGSEAYSRRGDLKISNLGMLENGNGNLILGNGGPISLPPIDKIEISVDGVITIRPTGQDERTLATVDRIRLVNPPLAQLYKGEDGLFRLKDGSDVAADASVTIVTGALESSNVNLISSLVTMISLARQFEMDIKTMHTIAKNDEAAAATLRIAQ